MIILLGNFRDVLVKFISIWRTVLCTFSEVLATTGDVVEWWKGILALPPEGMSCTLVGHDLMDMTSLLDTKPQFSGYLQSIYVDYEVSMVVRIVVRCFGVHGIKSEMLITLGSVMVVLLLLHTHNVFPPCAQCSWNKF